MKCSNIRKWPRKTTNETGNYQINYILYAKKKVAFAADTFKKNMKKKN